MAFAGHARGLLGLSHSLAATSRPGTGRRSARDGGCGGRGVPIVLPRAGPETGITRPAGIGQDPTDSDGQMIQAGQHSAATPCCLLCCRSSLAGNGLVQFVALSPPSSSPIYRSRNISTRLPLAPTSRDVQQALSWLRLGAHPTHPRLCEPPCGTTLRSAAAPQFRQTHSSGKLRFPAVPCFPPNRQTAKPSRPLPPLWPPLSPCRHPRFPAVLQHREDRTGIRRATLPVPKHRLTADSRRFLHCAKPRRTTSPTSPHPHPPLGRLSSRPRNNHQADTALDPTAR